MHITFFLKESSNYLVFSYTKPFSNQINDFSLLTFGGRSLLQPRVCCLFIDFKSTASKREGRGSGFLSLIVARYPKLSAVIPRNDSCGSCSHHFRGSGRLAGGCSDPCTQRLLLARPGSRSIARGLHKRFLSQRRIYLSV